MEYELVEQPAGTSFAGGSNDGSVRWPEVGGARGSEGAGVRAPEEGCAPGPEGGGAPGPEGGGVRDAVRRAMEVCPVEVAIAVVGGSWKMTIVKNLVPQALRFGELRRAVGPVSERTMTRQLRELERDGVLNREVFAEVPPRVEYSLSQLGRTLVPLVVTLDEWGADYLRQMGSTGAAVDRS